METVSVWGGCCKKWRGITWTRGFPAGAWQAKGKQTTNCRLYPHETHAERLQSLQFNNTTNCLRCRLACRIIATVDKAHILHLNSLGTRNINCYYYCCCQRCCNFCSLRFRDV